MMQIDLPNQMDMSTKVFSPEDYEELFDQFGHSIFVQKKEVTHFLSQGYKRSLPDIGNVELELEVLLENFKKCFLEFIEDVKERKIIDRTEEAASNRADLAWRALAEYCQSRFRMIHISYPVSQED